MMAMALGSLILAPKIVECQANGVVADLCTFQACLDACKKKLNNNFTSAACFNGPNGKYCFCFF